MIKITIHGYQIDKKVSYLLKKELIQCPISMLGKLIRHKQIRVNNKRTRLDYILAEQDTLSYPDYLQDYVSDKNHNKATIKVDNKIVDMLKQSIIYDDENYIVLNKQAGIAVQGGSKVKDNIDDYSQYFYPDSPLKIVHRLDKDTSGILVMAKNIQSAGYFSSLLKNRQVKKFYYALVHNRPTKDKDIIQTPLYDKNKDTSISASTKYEIISSSEKFSLLKIQLLTGRKHQIRKHCQSLGCPILGDDKYGYEQNKNQTQYLHLHAYQIEFTDMNGDIRLITADIPQEFSNTTTKLFSNN